jgi:hypothetical protein
MGAIRDVHVLADYTTIFNGNIVASYYTYVSTHIDIVSEYQSRVELLASILRNGAQPGPLVNNRAVT